MDYHVMDTNQLNALKQNAQSLNNEGGGNKFWRPQVGKNIIRMMPPFTIDPIPTVHLERTEHYFSSKYYPCLQQYQEHKNGCPLCKAYLKLSSVPGLNANNLRRMKARATYLYSIIAVDDSEEKNWKLVGDIQIFAAPWTVHQALLAAIGCTTYGNPDPYHPINGHPMVVIRPTTFEGKNNYEVRSSAHPVPLPSGLDIPDLRRFIRRYTPDLVTEINMVAESTLEAYSEVGQPQPQPAPTNAPQTFNPNGIPNYPQQSPYPPQNAGYPPSPPAYPNGAAAYAPPPPPTPQHVAPPVPPPAPSQAPYNMHTHPQCFGKYGTMDKAVCDGCPSEATCKATVFSKGEPPF